MATPAVAQVPTRTLTIDAIYDPQTRVDFSGAPATNIRWIDADTYLLVKRGEGGSEWLRVQAASGQATPLFDAARMEASLASTRGIDRDAARRIPRSSDLVLNPSRTGALVSTGGDLFFYDFASSRTRRLTATDAAEEEAMFSPNGQQVAFIRANNLFVVNVASGHERALTTDGSAEILNGKLDWLYQEEIYGRGRFRGYWWSPDSTRLAFLQLDERPVPEYTVIDQLPYRATLEATDYPKAGDANPGVKLGIVPIAGGNRRWVDLASYAGIDLLIVDVDWHPDSRRVIYQVQDREQTWLDLNQADAVSGATKKLLRETTRAWVNVNGSPVWLDDGSFLWFSERSGFRHLYLHRSDGSEIRQITNGRWDVRTLYGVDERAGLVYFDAGARRHIDTDIYRVTLEGTALTRISKTDGTHRAIFNPPYTTYVGIRSDVATPPQVRLHQADGSELRVIDANPVRALTEYRLSVPEFVEVKARDGFVMDAMLVKPPDFEPTRRYPVYQVTYAGPGTASVRNRWGGSTNMFYQLLAQHGVVVWVLDNRSAGGKGVEPQWPIYGNLGELELRDLEDGIAWLKEQSYVDPSRIALYGWSYGGFMTAYALTHSTSWAAGVVGAPVTDWRNYDSVYTERYMKTPQNNPDGYKRTAPRFAADRLQARMLLIHGTIDDNVHSQNSEQFVYELQRAGKSFEFMIYPRSRHGIGDPLLNKHLQQTIFDFVLRTVGAGRAVPDSTASR
jgi:dipeptidyl-peptidase 4